MLRGKEGGPGIWGILFSSELLYKFSLFNMVKCKWQKKVFFQTVEDKGKISSSERMDRIVGDTVSDQKFVSSYFPASRLDLNKGAVRTQSCYSKA